jgi:hypothetical protein
MSCSAPISPRPVHAIDFPDSCSKGVISERSTPRPDSISECQGFHPGEGVTHAVARRRRSVEHRLATRTQLIELKCDQLKPLCSRCSRLHIMCVGSGQQRYKFKQQEGSLLLSNNRKEPFQRPQISRTPSNEQTLLAGALVDKFKKSTDLRYHLSWTYGGYLEDVPRRLGKSEALDAAVDALVCAHSHFAKPHRALAPEALSKYSRAIVTLRVCLNDPMLACTAETLCAVTLLLISQVSSCHLYSMHSHHLPELHWRV